MEVQSASRVLRGGHEPVAGGSDGDTVKENALKEMIKILPPGHLFLHLLPFQSRTVPHLHLSLSLPLLIRPPILLD